MTGHLLTHHNVSDRGFTPLKITVAPNGARRGRKDHQKLPIAIDEIAVTAKQCADAGADEIHLHVRDAQGMHSLDAGLYREAIAAIAQTSPDMTVQITTEAAGVFSVTQQLEVLECLQPRAASVSVREIARDIDLAPRLYGVAREADIAVQHILYDPADAALLSEWQAEGFIAQEGCDVLLVLGRYAPPEVARVEDLSAFVSAVVPLCESWTVCAFGKTEHAVACAAMQMGGHVRIGFENNLCRPDGTLAEDNAENIRRTVSAASAMGRSLLKKASTT
ncbi:3-keto-5-aminohexanoate cleavage protein [Shimia sp. R11_0]|uniref:3-keto-5-aminohexanoate cleavage protein n=1 Tax=Shimia sp. R11_0 TaxID=2821096 RepID=UPI001ADA3774|nr:3-keto-5-aminohexanoate cleavage protein [Shimia sp. R11_0]MBO9476598.1 3-keto-5-aminohexanoate cleavage protein [Shimia sp. R11_0]